MELNTKSEMLDSIRAHRARWEALLAEVGEERMLEPGVMDSWTFKDVAAHLTGWRDRVTVARIEAGMRNEPLGSPPWPSDLDEEDDADVEVINEWIYQHNRDRPLSEVLADARESWRRMEAAVERLTEQELIQPGRFAWMNGYALGEVVPGSSGHFEEHEEMVRAWLDGSKGSSDLFHNLEPPPPTPADELCTCEGDKPIKLMSALGYNPLHCIDCNLERVPASLPLDGDIVQGIAYWRSLYDAIDRLWLASGEYEEWAKAQLSNINSPINVRGLEVQRELNARHKCYYWYFQDQSADNFQPLTTCPVCGNPFTSYNAGIFPQFLCEKCHIITVRE